MRRVRSGVLEGFKAPERGEEVALQLPVGRRGGGGAGDDDHIAGGAEIMLVEAEDLAQTPADAIADDGLADLAGDSHAKARGGALLLVAGEEKNNQQGSASTAPLLEDTIKLFARSQPMVGRERETPVQGFDQRSETVRRWRPLARRRARTLRPLLVAMRARNPCFLARRRLFGWKVLFIGRKSCRNQRSASERTAPSHVKAGIRPVR